MYGAPMGRADTHDDGSRELPVKFNLVRLRMVDYDYDEGGAYWGGNSPTGVMYRAYCPDGVEYQVNLFIRAKSRADAKQMVRDEYPRATFYN
jgi:hypothetical protein